MNLNRPAGEYEMALKSLREHHLMLDTLIEGAYIVNGLPGSECIARFGRTKTEIQRLIDGWR